MNVYEGKKDTDKWFPVRLVDSVDLKTPETGKVFGDVTVKYGYEAATSESTYTVATGNWKEQGDGNYWLQAGASEFTSEGKYIAKVEVSGCHDYNFVVEVRDKTLAELIDDIEAGLQDGYWADIDFRIDDDEPKDRYAVRWFKNVGRLTSGITSPTITVRDEAGAALINAEAMSDVGNGQLLYSEATDRQVMGTPYEVIVTATIDGAVRTWSKYLGRDI